MFNFFPGRGRDAPQDIFRSELHQSTEAVSLIDNPVKLENDCDFLVRPASTGCLHFMCVAEAFDSESESVISQRKTKCV